MASASDLVSIIKVIKVIAKIPQELRFNREKCQHLANRIIALEGHVMQSSLTEKQCKQLLSVLEETKNFMEEFKDLNIVMYVLRRYDDKELFAELTSKINDCIHDLNFGMLVSIDNEYKKDLIEDESFIEEEILQNPYKENTELKEYLREIRTSLLTIKEVDPYNLIFLKKIGEGGYGEVFEGIYKNQRVAIKKLVTPPNHSDIKYVYNYFKKEIRLHSILEHPSIIKLIGVCSVDPTNLCIVMPYAELGNLYNFDKDTLDNETKLSLLQQLSSGLYYLHHAHNILHCDLKSPNILLFKGFKLCICDFGFSHIKSKLAVTMSKGYYSPSIWISPELLDGEDESFSSDVYAFGTLVYEIYHSERPWAQLKPSQIITKILQGQLPGVSPDVDLDIKSIIEDCWTYDKNKRPTMKQIHNRLERKTDRLYALETKVNLLSLELIKLKQEQNKKIKKKIVFRTPYNYFGTFIEVEFAALQFFKTEFQNLSFLSIKRKNNEIISDLSSDLIEGTLLIDPNSLDLVLDEMNLNYELTNDSKNLNFILYTFIRL